VRDGPRWQLVLGCTDHAVPPFSKETLVGFRARLVALDLDRRLVERTVALNGPAAGQPATGKLQVVEGQPVVGSGPGDR
jgi:hypothetical protein